MKMDVRSAFPYVAFAVRYSRNQMRQKGDKSSRPKFHVFFPIDVITRTEQYASMKRRVAQIFPFFDNNALDAGRFFFGTQNPKVKIFASNRNLTAFLDEYYATHSQPTVQVVASAESAPTDNTNDHNEQQDIILEGTRNNILLDYAEQGIY